MQLRVLADRGVPTVNRIEVVENCGDKLRTSSLLQAAGVPTPDTRVASTPEAALEAIEELGYPVVLKPTVGSWGRLIARINDRDAAEALIEHKSTLGSYQHSIFYLQRYVDKPERDIRVVRRRRRNDLRHLPQGVPLGHQHRARRKGGELSGDVRTGDPVPAGGRRRSAAGWSRSTWSRTETAGCWCWRSTTRWSSATSIEPTGVDIPARMIDFVERVATVGWAAAQRREVA